MLMPDTSQPAVHKPFYRRIWFLSLVGLLVCLVGAAGFVYFWVIVRYEKKAEEFDLAKLEDLESASVIYDRYGQVYGKIFIRNREQVSLSQISPYLVAALISVEDNRFYEHRGIDFWGHGPRCLQEHRGWQNPAGSFYVNPATCSQYI